MRLAAFSAVSAALLSSTLAGSFAFAAPPPGSRTVRPPLVAAPQVQDIFRRLDPFEYDLWTTNFGSLAFDLAQGAPGLEFPRGSGKHVMFASGLWVGARVAGQKRVALAEYGFEWQPGRILGGTFEDPTRPELVSWKVVTADGYSSPNDSAAMASVSGDPVLHHGWGEYAATAGATGAPVRVKRLPEDGNPTDSVDVLAPDLPGAWALWSVFNDADPAAHLVSGTAPLGLEVRQVVYGHPLLPQVAFVRWTLVHKGTASLDSAYVGFWADPDVGNPSDDRIGWSAERAMGYAYNGQGVDGIYGATPPATGILFLEGPPGVGLGAFAAFISGTDPGDGVQTYAVLQGLDINGVEPVDPTTNQPTRFMFPGDPLTQTGWLDPVGADKRSLVSVGPFSLAPGDSTELTFGFVVAQGLNRFDSIQRLFCNADYARTAYEQDLRAPFPPTPPECLTLAQCPVPAATWDGFCADPSSLPPNALTAVAGQVASQTRSVVLAPPLVESFCDSVAAGVGGTPRERAVREYLAFLANLNAFPGMVSPAGTPVGLSSDAPVICSWSAATTAGELGERAPLPNALEVTYVEVDAENPRDYQPVDWGGQAYQGGVDFALYFLGSTLDPKAEPDSFPHVEVRFDATSTQKAYRYLRLELDGGGIPPGGREYRYGGYHPVPLVAIDTETGETLELAFVERATVDGSGTILGPGLPPTFDATWQPSADDDGGREYLFVLRRPDGGSPRPAMEVDGAIVDLGTTTPPPALYAAWLHRIDPDDQPEPGEMLVFAPFQTPPSNGVDARMLALGELPQDDPKTIAGYGEIASCLAAINAGIGLGLECDTSTPVALTLEEGVVEGGVARLAWYVTEQGAGPFDLARRPAGDAAAPWSVLARLTVDGTRRVRYEDRAIAPGERWTYGLFDPADPSRPLDTVTLDVPATTGFALRVSTGTRGVAAQAHFTLPARGEARLVLYDAAGRKRHEESFGVLEPGAHRRPLAPAAARGAPGLYFAKLVFGGRSVVARAVLLD